ncbi:hypothetical protein Ahy_A10g047608 [Arachis hypogaea]|uniref:Uncharacterized protein n=1 Tax=Arachis hypogaea TaxID=3818 RepID=A0A445B323_ARAHY|nr:hypothetical protein Ahy_A10g047608 [Arachis hypogaea]
MAVKNYNIRWNVKYRVLEEVRRFDGAHTCLVPTMSQDHAQNSDLICKVVLPMIKTDLSVSILVLQSAVHQSYHFKPKSSFPYIRQQDVQWKKTQSHIVWQQ